jgi:hypothetical protein
MCRLDRQVIGVHSRKKPVIIFFAVVSEFGGQCTSGAISMEVQGSELEAGYSPKSSTDITNA